MHCLEPLRSGPPCSAFSGCSVPRPQKAETAVTPLSFPEQLLHVVLRKYLSMFSPLVQFNSKGPFPRLSFLSLFMKYTLSGGNESMKYIPIIPFLKVAGFYVTHSVLIHLTNVYVLTACQPCAGYWERMDGNHNGTDPAGLL